MHIFTTARLIPLLLCLAWAMPTLAASPDEQAARCMALNLYWEARSESREGMLAVGWVVLNRLEDERYPASVCAVVKQGGETPPCEWSWWCDGRSDRPKEAKAWQRARKLAQLLLTQPPRDPTHGALWYHHTSLKRPAWLKAHQQTAHIGKHVFYREQ